MKNRTSSHFFILCLIVVLTAISHYSIHYGALIRGYETSLLTAARNIFLLCLLAVLPVFLKRFAKFQGNWTLYTSAVLLFSIGLTVQYRLFSDPEYTSRKDKAEARQEKIKTLQLHYIQENYSPEKKQMMGLPPTPPKPGRPFAGNAAAGDRGLFRRFFVGQDHQPHTGDSRPAGGVYPAYKGQNTRTAAKKRVPDSAADACSADLRRDYFARR